MAADPGRHAPAPAGAGHETHAELREPEQGTRVGHHPFGEGRDLDLAYKRSGGIPAFAG